MADSKGFNWRRDVGKIEPKQVGSLARQSGKSLEDFARDFMRSWPMAGEPTDDQVRGMVNEIRRQPDAD
jgi:hypothetical protein